ncbi:hypothetical protein HDK77DRAFT_42115 [Phyllosticta capitalensis]
MRELERQKTRLEMELEVDIAMVINVVVLSPVGVPQAVSSGAIPDWVSPISGDRHRPHLLPRTTDLTLSLRHHCCLPTRSFDASLQTLLLTALPWICPFLLLIPLVLISCLLQTHCTCATDPFHPVASP